MRVCIISPRTPGRGCWNVIPVVSRSPEMAPSTAEFGGGECNADYGASPGFILSGYGRLVQSAHGFKGICSAYRAVGAWNDVFHAFSVWTNRLQLAALGPFLSKPKPGPPQTRS